MELTHPSFYRLEASPGALHFDGQASPESLLFSSQVEQLIVLPKETS
jgi:hypothetical protein